MFELGGSRLRVGSVQLSPFDAGWAARDTSQLLHVFNRGVPGLLGGDFNGVGSNETYDHDPYREVPWHSDHVFQLTDTGTFQR